MATFADRFGLGAQMDKLGQQKQVAEKVKAARFANEVAPEQFELEKNSAEQQLELQGLKGQALQQEMDIMKDQSRFRNMYDATQQAMMLQPEQRNEFLQNRLNQLREQGLPTQQTEYFMQASPEEQEKIASGLTALGTRLGHLQTANATRPKNLITKKVKVPKTAVNESGERVPVTGQDGKPVMEERYVGFNPTTGEPVADLGLAGESGGINIDMGERQTEYQKQMGKNIANIQQNLYESINKSRNNVASFDQMENIVNSLPEDAGGGWIESLDQNTQSLIRGVANFMGFNTDEMDTRTMIDGLRNRITLASREPGSGPMTDNDFDQLVKGMPSSLQTPKQLQRGIKVAKYAEKYKMDRAKKESELLSQVADGTIDMTRAQQMIDEWVDNEWLPNNPSPVAVEEEAENTGGSLSTGDSDLDEIFQE